jgi:four helix bundle protein
MEKFVLREKSFNFALRCIRLYQYLTNNQKEFVISKQLLRSGTAVGALISEGRYAESKPDFIHKYHIALKECNETLYWIKLLFHSNYITKDAYKSLIADVEELLRLITSSIMTIKKNIKEKNDDIQTKKQ